MNFKAIVFDFDGVIIDSEPLHFEAFKTVLEPEGITFTWEEYLRDYVGFDDRDALRFAFAPTERELDDHSMQEFIRRKAAAFAELASSPSVTLYPGVMEIVNQFSGKLPIAICSGALLEDIEPVVKRFGIADIFDVIVTADQVEKSKPDPESYRLSVERLSSIHGPLLPADCVAIEDTPAGITSAKEAGLVTVAVGHTHSLDTLGHADLAVPALSDVAAQWGQGERDA